MAEPNDVSNDSIENPVSPVETEEKVRRKMEPRAKRNLKIMFGVIGGIVLITGAISFFGDSTAPKDRSAIKASNQETRVGETSQAYKDLQRQENQQREEAARQSPNASFLPSLIEGAGDSRLAEIEEPQRNEVKMVPTPSGGPKEKAMAEEELTGEYLLSADPLENPRVARRYEAQMAQMAALMQANGAVPQQTTVVLPGYELENRQIQRDQELRLQQAAFDEQTRQLALAQQTAVQAQAGAKEPPMYGTQLLKSAYITLDKPIEADYDRLVIATVRTGLYRGARLQGQATRQADRLNVIFTQMVYNGMVYPINAVGLDNETTSGMIEGDYKAEWFDRLVMPFVFGLGAGYAEARGETGNQVIVGVNGQLAQQQNEPTEKEAVARGIAEGLRTTQKIYQETTRQPTVSTEINRNLIVVWLATGV